MKMLIVVVGSLFSVATSFSQTFTHTFDLNPPLATTQTPGSWYVDRKAPASFDSQFFDGDNRLHIGVSALDFDTGSNFYNTQGRKLDLVNGGVGSSVSAQLYIPSAWANANVTVGLWLTAFDIANTPAGYPIVGFTSTTSGNAHFQVWDDVTGYVALNSTPINYDAWNTLKITFTPSGFDYGINGATVFTDTAAVANGAVTMANVILQTKNYNSAYDVYWDNLATPIPESGPASLLMLGGLVFKITNRFRRQPRSPFPRSGSLRFFVPKRTLEISQSQRGWKTSSRIIAS